MFNRRETESLRKACMLAKGGPREEAALRVRATEGQSTAERQGNDKRQKGEDPTLRLEATDCRQRTESLQRWKVAKQEREEPVLRLKAVEGRDRARACNKAERTKAL